MTTLHAVARARAALLDVFQPLSDLFALLHARYPHLVDDSSPYHQSFSFLLDGTGGAMVLQPTLESRHHPTPTPTPFLEVARVLGMTGHATTRLLAKAEDARHAIDAAAPHAGARFYDDPSDPLSPYTTIFSEAPKYTRHQTPSIRLAHGALRTTLFGADSPQDHVSWKLHLLARLRSPGRAQPYLQAGAQNGPVWADCIEDALLMMAADKHLQEDALRFLRTPAALWSQQHLVTPQDLVPDARTPLGA